jgi:hypothetical protein
VSMEARFTPKMPLPTACVWIFSYPPRYQRLLLFEGLIKDEDV